MTPKLCSRCKKRPAVIFITRMEGDKSTPESLCLQCAKELNIKPVTDLLEKMNLSDEDIALGLIFMVVQSIGSSAVFSAMNSDIKDFVMIGNLAQLPQCDMIFPLMEKIYGVKFHIPPYAEFRTALGAALAFKNK